MDSLASFGDGFAGTGCVGQFIASQYPHIRVYAVDAERYSTVINYAKLCVPYTSDITALISKLNSVSPVQGLVTTHYSPIGGRMYFTTDNAQHIDATRIAIEQLRQTISSDAYTFLLASLVCSADKVANVSCVYGAYLKEFKKSAIKPFQLLPVHTSSIAGTHTIVQQDIQNTDWTGVSAVYFDPPYNNRQYGSNYFLLNYILDYTNKETHGITGMTDYFKSPFCQTKSVLRAFEALLTNPTLPPHVFISYNNEGLVSQDIFRQLLSKYGRVVLYSTPYKKFKAQQSVDGYDVMEYVWYLERDGERVFEHVVL